MKPEAQISRDCIDVMRQAGFSAWSNEQGYRKERGGTRTTPGIPDCIFAGHGWAFFVEFKTPKGKESVYQQIFRREWNGNGGMSLVWRSADDAFDWLVRNGIIVESGAA